MRFFLIFFIFFLIITPVSFSQNQKLNKDLYSSYLKGLLYIERGDYLQGLEELGKAKAKDPKSIHIRLRMATVLIRLDRIDEAEAVLKEAKEIDSDNLDVSLALIFVYSYAEKDKELEEEYEVFLQKAHELKPKDIGISEYLAQFYFYKKKPKEAIAIYERILEVNPNYVEALFWLGYLYEESGAHTKAIDTWKRGLKIDSDFAPILNSLGYTYAQGGVNLKEAEGMIQRALEQEPENGAYLDSLGWIYFQRGELEEAEEYLTRAISLVKDPEIYEHLGDLYIKMGDKEKGLIYYKDGLLQFPDNRPLQQKIREHGREDKNSK